MNFGGDIIINQGAIRARIDGANANLGTNNVLALRGGVLEVDAERRHQHLLAQSRQRPRTGELGRIRRPTSAIAAAAALPSSTASQCEYRRSGQTLVWNGTSGGNRVLPPVRAVAPARESPIKRHRHAPEQPRTRRWLGRAAVRVAADHDRSALQHSSTSFPTTPSVRTRITGVISGSAATRLMKGGPSLLELTAANTYAGGTVVDFGTLR